MRAFLEARLITGAAFLFGWLGLGVFSCPAQTAFVNFNATNQLTNLFFLWNNGGTPGNFSFAANPTNGVGGSGGVSVFQNVDTTATYKSGSWNFSTNGATVTVAALIKANGQVGTDRVQLGIANNKTNGLDANTNVAFETYRLLPKSSTVWTVLEQFRTGTTTTETTISNVNIIPGHWYKFIVSMTNTSGLTGNYGANCGLFDYGLTGLTPLTNAVNFSTVKTHTNQIIAKTSAVYPAIRAYQDAGIDAWDNFLVYRSNSLPTFTLTLTNTSVVSNNPATFAVLAEGPGTISYSWFTNGVLFAGQPLSQMTVALVGPGLTSVWAVAKNANGSTTNTATVNVLAPSLPVVTNAAPVVQAAAAVLNGGVVSTGGRPTTVVMYYGPTDGGTNAVDWTYNLSLGTESNAFSLTLTQLATNTTYYYTASASNAVGVAWAAPSVGFTTLASYPSLPMLTYHNDNFRTGANTNETLLTPSSVNTNNFGKLFSYTVDGYVYAQPLVMTNVNIPGQGVHNILFVATEHNTVYAFDADNYVNAPYWTNSFSNPSAGITPVPVADAGPANISPEIGITGTPVIDPVSGTIYVEANTKEVSPTATNYVHRLHALDVATGLERLNSPAVIDSTNYPGSGTPGFSDSDGHGHVIFNKLREMNRPALLLLNGVVYIGYGSHGDQTPYHGWLFGYDANTLQQTGVFNTTPSASAGAFWGSGCGPAADASGNIYVMSGNGTYDGSTSWGDSFLKFSTTNGLKLVDWFTPFNQASLSASDNDVGSAGMVILPDSAGGSKHQHLLISGSKAGAIYMLDQTNLGHFDSTNDGQIVQEIQNVSQGMWSTPAYWNGLVYFLSKSAAISAYNIFNGVLNTVPVQLGNTVFGYPGATVCISANGNSNAIAWALQTDANPTSGPEILRAYNATNLSVELYDSGQNMARDNPGGAVKYAVPAVVNGKVYVGAEYTVAVFGNGVFQQSPSINPNGGNFTNSILVNISDPMPGTGIYYTLDGTTPTSNSILYTGPFTLTNTTVVQAVAVKPGSMNSATVIASFVDSSAIGHGIGLTGAYYANQIQTFNGSPTLTRVDPVVNFNWSSTPPSPLIGTVDFTVRWTGSVQPQFTEPYTFTVNVDDGARLWVNGKLLIDDWSSIATGAFSGTITLNAQQLYDIELDYFQGTGTALVSLGWNSPSTPFEIIPQTQLYPFTNPPPGVVLNSPANGAQFTAGGSVTLDATAASQYNSISGVAFYANSDLLGTVTNVPYTLTTTGLAATNYTFTVVATDGSGMSATSAPVNVTVVNGSGLPYGLTNRPVVSAFFNMPTNSAGTMPPTLSQTGLFTNMTNLGVASGLIPYAPNVPFWSDGALKTRWMAVPYDGGLSTPDQQIGFAPTGEWTFPEGTVFVKHFDLVTDETDSNAPLRRLETRVLVRDNFGGVYGVTYKWRPDNSDADLLTNSLSEDIAVMTTNGAVTQTWYYPSPNDCLTCHTPVANYVLGVKTRQLNGDFTYSQTGQTDNQLRTLNSLGMFNPAIDEGSISNFAQLVAVTNQNATLENLFRSYIDVNCSQCHQPNGTGPTFDARYDTPLTNQNIINAALINGNLGYDHSVVVSPQDIWRSALYQRVNTLQSSIQMPPLARNTIDSNDVAMIANWINSLPGTPALAPPTIQPQGGQFLNTVTVSIESPDEEATVYYTLDGSLPTTNSTEYIEPFEMTNSATLNANAFEDGFTNSVATTAVFNILSGVGFTGAPFFDSGGFELQVQGLPNVNYVLQTSTDLVNWVSIDTNNSGTGTLFFTDPNNTNSPAQFYRIAQPPPSQ